MVVKRFIANPHLNPPVTWLLGWLMVIKSAKLLSPSKGINWLGNVMLVSKISPTCVLTQALETPLK